AHVAGPLDRLSNHPLLAGADAQALAPVDLAVGAEHAPQALHILPVNVDVAGAGSAENLDLGGSAEAAESTHRESSVMGLGPGPARATGECGGILGQPLCHRPRGEQIQEARGAPIQPEPGPVSRSARSVLPGKRLETGRTPAPGTDLRAQ